MYPAMDRMAYVTSPLACCADNLSKGWSWLVTLKMKLYSSGEIIFFKRYMDSPLEFEIMEFWSLFMIRSAAL